MSKLNRLAELKNKLGSKLGNVPVVPAMPAVALEHMAIEKKKPGEWHSFLTNLSFLCYSTDFLCSFLCSYCV